MCAKLLDSTTLRGTKSLHIAVQTSSRCPTPYLGGIMKNTTLGIAATMSAAVLILTGCSGTGADPEASQVPEGVTAAPADLVTAGTLTACIDPEYPPLEYYENGADGEIVGFDADGVRALAAYWGVEAKMNVTSFDGLMPGLQSGGCDVIFGGLYMSEERLAIADAAPIMNAGPEILAAPDKAGELTESLDLCGRTVAAQAASSNALTLTKLNEECATAGRESVNITEYPKTAETVLAVINGKADALIETNVAAAYMGSQNEGRLELVPGLFPTDTTFGVFTAKDSPISAPLAEALQALHEDGTLAAIAADYNLDPAILDVN